MKPRIPPSFPEGEKALLGACVLDNAILDECCSKLNARDFYLERNRVIFDAIMSLHLKKVPVDYLSLSRALKGMDKALGAEHIPAVIAELADATPSAANWRHYAGHVKRLSRLREIVSESTRVIDSCYEHNPDLEEISSRLQDIAYNATRDPSGNSPRDVGEGIVGFAESRRNVREPGISTGLSSIDDVIDGLQPGSLVAISGRPSMGKSSLALSMARKISMNHVCCFFSQEMTEAQLHTWLISGESGVDGRRLYRGGLTDYEVELAEAAERRVASMALYIDETPYQTVQQMKAKAKDLMISAGQLDVVFVDHLSKSQPTDKRAQKVHQIGQISSDLKTMAKELNLCVIVLVQLSRKIEDRPIKGGGRIPRSYDLRDSGEIEQDIDIHMGLYRPERYLDEMDLKERAELVPINKAILNIDKNRLGSTGRADLLWNGPTTTYSSPCDIRGDIHMDEI